MSRPETQGKLRGVALIADERERQVYQEGWSADHDDEHCCGEMAIAAACYAACAADERIFTVRSHESRNEREFKFRDPWPWSRNWDKRPTATPSMPEKVRMLEKAGALIAAEIDRLLRSDAAQNTMPEATKK